MGRIIKNRSQSPNAHPLMTKDNLNVDIDLKSTIIELSLAMTRRIVHHEIKRDPACLKMIYMQVLAAADISKGGTLYVHPGDWDKGGVQAMLSKSGISPVLDDTIESGGCRLKTPFGTVDSTIDSLLSRLGLALGEEV